MKVKEDFLGGNTINTNTGKDDAFTPTKYVIDGQEYDLYLVICDSRGSCYRTRMTFTGAERQVDSRFLTLMKGILVNMDHIEQIKESQCIMKNGSVYPIHVKKGKEVKQKWLNYKFAVIRRETEITGVRNEC
ncbi:MAG: hypothetical protein IJ128_05875 [Firmicutes bacterium]|nr:hypothetical protein [Bacillota bacterium]